MRKGRREPVGTGYMICGTKGNCYLSQISIPQVMKMVLLIDLTCCYSNISLWDFRMSISRKNGKENRIPEIGYMEFENAAHSYRPFPR